MGKLIFEGDDKVLQTISKSNRLRVKKYGLKVTLESKDGKVTIPAKDKDLKEEKPKESKSKKGSATAKKSVGNKKAK